MKVTSVLAAALFTLSIPYSSPIAAGEPNQRIEAVWTDPSNQGQQVLGSWTLLDLERKKQQLGRERLPMPDGSDSAVYTFTGPLLSDLVNQALEKLRPEQRALIDLLVIKGTTGEQALLPRAFVVKYPFLLALTQSGKSLGALAPKTVAPWTSRSKIRQEVVSLESLFVSGVEKIEFANYRERFPQYFLKLRTDPAALRGEKLFREACITCHAAGRGPAITELSGDQKRGVLVSSGHPRVVGMPKLSDRDRRSLVTFLELFKLESTAATSAQR